MQLKFLARDNSDILSLLPESHLAIIYIILLAAATCILNNKWLRIWQSGNSIDFNENLFVNSTKRSFHQLHHKLDCTLH